MLITPQSLDDLFVTFMAHYEMGARSATPVHPQLADVFSIPTGELDFPIPESWGQWKLWKKGEERTWRNFAAHSAKAKTEDYELSVSVPRDAIRFDKYQTFSSAFAREGRRSQMVWDKLVFDAILAGETSDCFDGVEYFSASHPVKPSDEDSAVQSNLHTGRGFSEANLDTTFGEFLAWKDANGDETGEIPDTILCGSSNFAPAKRVTTAEFNAAGATNIYRGMFDVVLVPGLGTSWILAQCKGDFKPVALNKAAEATMLPLTAPTDVNVINNRQFRYAGDASGSAVLTIPGLMHLCKQ